MLMLLCRLCACHDLISPCHTCNAEVPMVALGTADEDAYLSDDSVDPDDMTYEVTPAC